MYMSSRAMKGVKGDAQRRGVAPEDTPRERFQAHFRVHTACQPVVSPAESRSWLIFSSPICAGGGGFFGKTMNTGSINTQLP